MDETRREDTEPHRVPIKPATEPIPRIGPEVEGHMFTVYYLGTNVHWLRTLLEHMPNIEDDLISSGVYQTVRYLRFHLPGPKRPALVQEAARLRYQGFLMGYEYK